MQLLVGLIFTFGNLLFILIQSGNYYDNDAHIKKVTKYIFDKECFQVESASFANKVEYDKILKIKETKNAYMIFVSDRIGHIILKSSLNQIQLAKLRVIVQKIRGNYLKKVS